MSVASCRKLAKEKYGVELDTDQLKSIGEQVEAVLAKAANDGINGSVAIDAAIQRNLKAAEMLKAVVKRNHHLNFEAKTKIRSYLAEHWKDHPEEGIRTLLTGVQADRVGAKDAASVLQASLADKYIGTLVSELNMPGKDGRAPIEFVKPSFLGKRNKHERDVMQIMAHMNVEHPNKAMWAGKPPSMVKAAEILLKIQEVARKDANDAGSHQIGKLEGRIMRRTHDMFKMQDHGYDTWKADMENWGVLEASEISPDKWADISKRHYNQTVAGKHVINPNPEVSGIPGGMGNISKSMAHERVFHFKDTESEIAYFEKYGRGGLLENVVFGLELSAQRTGLMRKLGPNAKANLEEVANEIGYKISKEGTPAQLKRFETRRDDIFKRHYRMVDGSLFVPGSHTVAKVGQWYRSIKMMALLGKAVLSAIADIPLYGLEVRFKGGSFFGGMMEAVGTLFRAKTNETDQVLAQMGVIADAMRNSTLNRFDPDHMSEGLHAKLTEKFFNLSLLTPYTDKLRTGFALSRGLELAGLSKKNYKNLPEGWQRMLRNFNIDDAKWDVIRKAKQKAADGRTYLTPEGVLDLDDATIAKYLEGQGKIANATSISFARNDIADNFRSYYHSRAHTASLEPDAGTRANLIGETQSGTWMGEIVRSLMLFKSFPVAVLRQVVGREIRGHKSEIMDGFVDSSYKTLKDGEAMGNLARMMVSTTVFGALVLQLKAISNGHEPASIEDIQEDWGNFLVRSMLQGGALGIYGDFLVGEAKNRFGGNAVTTLAGPLGGDFNTVSDIVSQLMSEDKEMRDIAAQALNSLYRTAVPGNNLFYTKAGMDYLVLYNMMEAFDPGSLRKMEKRGETQMNRHYIVPPSTVIPKGGGMPQF